MLDPFPLATVGPLFLLAPLLCAVAYFDLRYMRIPNWLSLLALATFALACLIAPPEDLGPRLLAGGSVFLLGFAAFALGLIGGGDVKILSCLTLFIPASGLAGFAQLFALSLAVGIVGLTLLRAIRPLRHIGWLGLAEQRGFPMGISIAMAGLAYPLIVTLPSLA